MRALSEILSRRNNGSSTLKKIFCLPRVECDSDAGFCRGVDSALRKLMPLLVAGKPVHADGEIIHNTIAMNILAAAGLKRDEDSASTEIIRTHGTLQNNLIGLHHRKSKVLNLTCSNVSQVQSCVKKYSAEGYHCIITGHPDHAEVLSVASYASADQVTVIQDVQQADQIPPRDKYLLISQTTFSTKNFETISGYLSLKYGSRIIIKNTICEAASSRQSSIDRIDPALFDTVIVVGGKHSSNTQKLAQRAVQRGFSTLHIENAGELDADLAKTRGIYITAGASTPPWIIDECVRKAKIQRLPHLLRPLAGAIAKAGHSLHPGIITAFSAAAILSPRIEQTLPALLFTLFAALTLAEQQSLYERQISGLFRRSDLSPAFIFAALSLACAYALSQKSSLPPASFVPALALIAAGILAGVPVKKRSILQYAVFETMYPAFLFVATNAAGSFDSLTILILLYALPWHMAARAQRFAREYMIERAPFIFLTGRKMYLKLALFIHGGITAAIIFLACARSLSPVQPILAAAACSVALIVIILRHKISAGRTCR